ncbi:MAG: glycosyltransferase family 4 protein [Thermosphaera sp.]|uniref:glycosyltransferase family 4 protein n=1 Tax=Infirmifilum sp. TaxID=2856575 RepID=UPI003C7F5DBC
MKVLVASNLLAWDKPGGGETQVLRTLEFLKRKGIEIEYISADSVRKIRSFDIFHVFGVVHHLYDFLLYWKKELKRPSILTPLWWSPEEFYLHTNKLAYLKYKANTLLRRTLKKKWIQLQNVFDIRADIHGLMIYTADVIVTTSVMEKELLGREFGISPNKIEVVYNGVDERFYYATPDLFVKKYGLKDFVLEVAAIHPKKNQLALITALMNKKDIPIVFIGPVINKYYYQKCLKLAEKRGNVYFLGQIPHEDPLLASAYAAARVAVLPSWFDAPGLVALEAALAGTRVVITNRGPMREYFNDLVFYINPNDLNDIEEKVLYAYYSSVDTTILREHVRRNFTWDNVLEPLLKIYRRVLEE